MLHLLTFVVNICMGSITTEQAIKMNESRWGTYELKDRYDWKSFQERHDNGETFSLIYRDIGMSYLTASKAVEMGLIIKHKTPRPPMSEESKQKISTKRKKWLKENPDKHPWKSKDKFKSKPCEHLKDFLRKRGIQFIEEYQPEIEGRFFSIDIALPDKLIALEVNGNQHYEKDGSLKPYYQERHELLELAGWDVYEIHYSSCFSISEWTDFLTLVDEVDTKIDFDYFNYAPIKKDLRKSPVKKERKRKVERPSKEELEQLILNYPMTQLGKMYGVSDNAVRKWCKSYEINLTNRKKVVK